VLKPTTADIVVAIGKVLAGDWIDPSERRPLFSCQLFDSAGEIAGEGEADTAAEAMALAWIHLHAPDALWLGRIRNR